MEKVSKFLKWFLQVTLPVALFQTFAYTQVEPFSSEHTVARYVILLVSYLTWHLYVNCVRDGKL